jgi:hypothetical protein
MPGSESSWRKRLILFDLSVVRGMEKPGFFSLYPNSSISTLITSEANHLR